MEVKVNLAESSTNNNKHKFNAKKQDSKKQKKIKGYCYNCGKPDHMANDCIKLKKDNKYHHQVDVIEEKNYVHRFV